MSMNVILSPGCPVKLKQSVSTIIEAEALNVQQSDQVVRQSLFKSQEKQQVGQNLYFKYSGNPNTGLVRYLNGWKQFANWMVYYSSHEVNTGVFVCYYLFIRRKWPNFFSLVNHRYLKWHHLGICDTNHLNTRPFDNRTSVDHLNQTSLVFGSL